MGYTIQESEEEGIVRRHARHAEVQTRIEEGMGLFCDLPVDTTDVTEQVATCIKTLSEYAEAVDWMPEMQSPVNGANQEIELIISENDRALHAGSYVYVNIMPKERFMRMQGCYYDAYHQPNTLCEAFFPLANTTPQELESSLNSMCQILGKYHRTFVSPSARSRI